MQTYERNRCSGKIILTVALSALIAIVATVGLLQSSKQKKETTGSTVEQLPENSETYNTGNRAIPDKLLELMAQNPDAREFVLNYPLKKDLRPEIDLQNYVGNKTVPLFLQWDERWGYTQYGEEMMGLSGCGPTCLSMVCVYLLDDAKYSPRYVADFAQRKGYYVTGIGSSWTLISSGGRQLGLDVTEIPLDENRIVRNLELGNPIICAMGPGDFTTTGHFIVLTGYENGKIRVNDPNSPTRSAILWDYSTLCSQIRNLWVCRT